jgi:hypothetical protein
MTAETNTVSAVTTYTNYWENGLLVNKTTYAVGTANAAAREERYNQDGSLESVTASAAHPVRYLYGVEPAGTNTLGANVTNWNTLRLTWTGIT